MGSAMRLGEESLLQLVTGETAAQDQASQPCGNTHPHNVRPARGLANHPTVHGRMNRAHRHHGLWPRGFRLARSLEKRGHSVAVIDIDTDAFRRLGPDFHGQTVKGVGFDRGVLSRAGIESADGFAAVSSGDNSNILAARVVRESFGVDNVVARIYDPGRAQVYERLGGIPTVATVRWAADKVLRRLLPEGSEPVWRDPPSGNARLIEVWVHQAGSVSRSAGSRRRPGRRSRSCCGSHGHRAQPPRDSVPGRRSGVRRGRTGPDQRGRGDLRRSPPARH